MDLSYSTVKSVHVGAVALTASLFILRCGWMIWSPARLTARWVRIVPHVIDTVLLLSGGWLAWRIGAAGVDGWLSAKLVGLAAYIAIGMVALRRGRTLAVRIGAALAALLVLGYIVSVALSKSAWGPLAGWA
jgi:uncharacterized membrane protein SirB2